MKSLILYDFTLIKTHDLYELNNICKQKNKSFEKIEEQCLSLTDYATQVRYPFYKFELNEDFVEEAIKNMEFIVEFIINILEKELN